LEAMESMGQAPRVAVVDDEPAIRTLLESELSDAGFEVRSAHDGPAGLVLIREWEPHVILLDIMMPKIDGISILPRYRSVTQAPILIVSAKGGTEDRVRGLRCGADQYIPKPFEIPELLARVRSALRRPVLDKPERITYADLTVDLRARSVQRGNRTIELRRREFELLVTLAREPRRVFTKEQLIFGVWGDESAVTHSALEAHVSYLRNAIDGPGDEPFITTVRGVGYRFS
jgi:DNA-binding response OmpR family regulator